MRTLLLAGALLLAVSAVPTASAWTIMWYTVGVEVQVFGPGGTIEPCLGVQAQGSGPHVDLAHGIIIYAGPDNGPNGYAGARINARCP